MMSRTQPLMLCGFFGLAIACSSSEQSSQPNAEPTSHEQHAATPGAQALQVTVPAGAKVFFVEPADGSEVKGALVDGKVSVKAKLGAEGITVRAAGEQVQGTGHHHIIIDGQAVPIGTVVPKDDTHLHFGKGQTEVEVPLTPGEHTLTMQFADGAHLSYGPELASTIKVKVTADPNAPAPAAAAAAPVPEPAKK